MNRHKKAVAVGAFAVAVVSTGAWTMSADAAVTQPVSGAGYYVPGQLSSGSLSFVVPSVTCVAGENSGEFFGVESAGATASAPTWQSGVQVGCESGVPFVGAFQGAGDFGFPAEPVLPGDKVLITFNHSTNQIDIKNLRTKLDDSIGIPEASNDAGVLFGLQSEDQPFSSITGGNVTLTATVNGGTLAAASTVKQAKRISGVTFTPTVISAKTGRTFTLKEVNHNVA